MLLWSSLAHPLLLLLTKKTHNNNNTKTNKPSYFPFQYIDASKFCLKDRRSMVKREPSAPGFDNIKINKAHWKAPVNQGWDLPREQLYSIVSLHGARLLRGALYHLSLHLLLELLTCLWKKRTGRLTRTRQKAAELNQGRHGSLSSQ